MKNQCRKAAEKTLQLLLEKHLTLASAESCTGGMIGMNLTSCPGASDVYQGGVISYANAVKQQILNVPESLLQHVGAVSSECCDAMCRNAAQLCHADCALATTGIAGPGGGSPEKPVGLVYIGAFFRGRVAIHECHFSGDREAVREQSTEFAFRLLQELVQTPPQERMFSDRKREMKRYIQSFYTHIPEFDENVNCKDRHTFEVVTFAEQLAENEEFSSHETALLKLAALYHDLGRFEQLKRYQTFLDAVSFDHGDFAAEMLEKGPWLEDIDAQDRHRVILAVRLHNKAALPEDLEPLTRKITEAVRDADKIDILRIMTEFYQSHDLNRRSVITLGLPPGKNVEPVVLEALLAGRNPHYTDAKSILDFVAIKAGWLRDLNFDASRREVVERKYMGELLNALPNTPQALFDWKQGILTEWHTRFGYTETQMLQEPKPAAVASSETQS